MTRERGSETTEMLIVAATVGLALLLALASLVPTVEAIFGLLLQTVTGVPGGVR
jgi:hypothetical protein